MSENIRETSSAAIYKSSEYGDYFTLIFHLRREKIVKED